MPNDSKSFSNISNLVIHHGGINHLVGANCKECEAVFLENPYVKNIIKNEREEICRLIDNLESTDPNTSLEQWKNYKRIRNAIRDRNLVDIGK